MRGPSVTIGLDFGPLVMAAATVHGERRRGLGSGSGCSGPGVSTSRNVRSTCGRG